MKPKAAAAAASGLFSPHRESLGLDSRKLSPGLVGAIVFVGGETHSSQRASVLLKRLGHHVSVKTAQRVLSEIGQELVEQRDQGQLSNAVIATPPSLAVVQCDGGRIMTREPDQGPGVYQPAWKETKNAGLFRMISEPAERDPHPELPAALADPRRVADFAELAEPELIAASKPSPNPSGKPIVDPHRPRVLVRTVLSSMADSATFGEQMRHEARQRRFDEAPRKAFVGDGLAWNWTIHREHFADYTPILDFLHVAGYLYAAACLMKEAPSDAWELYLRLATACWQGRTDDVICELQQWLALQSIQAEEVSPEHPLRRVADAWRYLSNNRERMNYPEYRRQGLPVTSSLMESLVKQVNQRVKGTEMFWNRPEGAERILQVRAAILSDDHRLERHLHQRPGCPFVRRTTQANLNNAP